MFAITKSFALKYILITKCAQTLFQSKIITMHGFVPIDNNIVAETEQFGLVLLAKEV
jgi:hypothetical protein